jgi:hypothetical protein
MAVNQSNIALSTFEPLGMSGCPVIFQGELMPLLAGIVFEASPRTEKDGRLFVRARYNPINEYGKIKNHI